MDPNQPNQFDPNQPNQFDPNDLDPNAFGGYSNMLSHGSFSPIRPANLFRNQPQVFFPPTNPMSNPAVVEQFQQWYMAQQQQQSQQQQQPQSQQQPQEVQPQQQPRKTRTKQPAKRRGKRQQQQQQQQEQQHLVDEDDDLEMVEETQFQQAQQQQQQNFTRTRSGAPSVPKKSGGTHWSEEECEALTKAWLHFSENSQEGNNQKSEKLWGDIIPYFFRMMDREPYRSYDSIISKWSTLKKELTDFLAIVNKAKLNIQSGTNDNDFMERVHAIYYKKNNKNFTHHLAWKVAEKHVTWFRQTTTEEMTGEASSDSNKRARTESSFGDFDLNLGNEFEDFDNDDFQGINTSRPMGRDKARKEAKGKGVASSSDEAISGKWDEHLAFAREKDLRKKEVVAQQKILLEQYNATLTSQQMLADVEVLMKAPDGTIHDENKDLVSDIQRQIRERYRK